MAVEQMKSWWMQLSPAGTQLELREVAVPKPAAGQLLVRMHAASLNRGEFLQGHGLHGGGTEFKPVGSDGAGEVVAVGAGVAGFEPGQRVMGRCKGAFAEYALLEAVETLRVPDNLSWVQASAVPLAFLVAHDMLCVQQKIQPGMWLLVNGVSSGVGVASMQLAQAVGAKVIGISGSADKLEQLKRHGLDFGIATREGDFSARVMDITAGHGADFIVNTVGGSMLAENLRAAAFEGRLAIVGNVDRVLRAELDLEALHTKRLCMYGVSNKLRSKEQRARSIPAFERDVVAALADGRITPVVDSEYPMASLPQALARMEQGQHIGKIVLRVV
jgi:NADPH2:quinone reductase